MIDALMAAGRVVVVIATVAASAWLVVGAVIAVYVLFTLPKLPKGF